MTEAGDHPLVSVVIPVHNGGQYLGRCLDSVMVQSLTDIEVIVIDDASTDSTPGVLDRYAATDDRFRVVTLPRNLGVSAARNAGLERSRGVFIAFVDADDHIDRGMLEELYRASHAQNAEVVACGITLVGEDDRVLGTVEFPLADGRHDHDETREALHEAFQRKLLWYPCRSLYTRKLIVDNNIRFDEGIRKGEDSLFNLEVLFLADGLVRIASAPYRYRQHPDSATAKPLANEAQNIERLAARVTAFYRANNFDARAYRDFYGQLLRSDLPTALVRLRNSPDFAVQVRSLVESNAVQEAFSHVRLRDLDAPLKVKLLLRVVKLGWMMPLLAVLRTSGYLSRRRTSGPRSVGL